MANESETFDTELFIDEIQNLPSIWDYTSDAYSNRIEKAKAWENLCSKLIDNFEEKEKKEKNECAVQLQKKWRSLRDCYNRELRINNTQKSGSGATKRRKYMYFDNLSFLKPIAERIATESSINNAPQNVDRESNEDRQNIEDGQPNKDNTRGRQKTTQRKTTKTTNQEAELIAKLSSRLSDRISTEEPKIAHTDSDLHFLLSLYEPFKAIGRHLKMDAQIEIFNVIKKYSQPHREGPSNSYGGYGYNTQSYQDRQHPMTPYGLHPLQVEVSQGGYGNLNERPLPQVKVSQGRYGNQNERPEFGLPDIRSNEPEFLLSPDGNAQPPSFPSEPESSPASQDSILSQLF